MRAVTAKWFLREQVVGWAGGRAAHPLTLIWPDDCVMKS
jgi:hypothetical protein